MWLNDLMLILRSARKEEYPAIRKLIWQVQINPMGLDWRRFIVIVDDLGRLLACGQVKPHADGSRELASLAVVPDYRGQGLASMVIEQLKELYGAPLHLSCRSELQPFYRKFGFRSLEPSEMPTSLLIYYRPLAFMMRLLGRPPLLAIMLWEG